MRHEPRSSYHLRHGGVDREAHGGLTPSQSFAAGRQPGQIKALEEEPGLRLFIRNSAGMRLSMEGEELRAAK
jgi:hypothetical protein